MLYGSENFSDELKSKLNQIYNTLKSSDSYVERANKLTLFDLVLISRVCNVLYGTAGPEEGRGTRSPYFRLLDAHNTLISLLAELEFNNNLIKANISSARGSTAAAEELLVNSAATLLKMLYVTCENAVVTLALTPGRPYNLPGLIEASLDKAYVKRNHTVRHKPRPSGGQPKNEPKGES